MTPHTTTHCSLPHKHAGCRTKHVHAHYHTTCCHTATVDMCGEFQPSLCATILLCMDTYHCPYEKLQYADGRTCHACCTYFLLQVGQIRCRRAKHTRSNLNHTCTLESQQEFVHASSTHRVPAPKGISCPCFWPSGVRSLSGLNTAGSRSPAAVTTTDTATCGQTGCPRKACHEHHV